jgi:NTE family protein
MSTPRIGLVLGGGGARGFAHIPVIEALDELGLTPTAIAGCSIGAIMGASRAGGLSGREIRERSLDMFGNRAAALARLWGLRPKRLADLLTGAGFGNFDAERVLDIFVGDAIRPSFADLRIPLTVSATDYYGAREAVLRSGDLRKAVAASIAIPMLFKPVLVDNRVMVDGGVVNPIPIDHLAEPVDLIVAVDVIGLPEPVEGRSMPGGTEAIFGATQLMMQAVARAKFAGRPPDIFVRPPVSGFRVLDFLRAREILEATEPVKDFVKRRLGRMLESELAETVTVEGYASPRRRRRLPPPVESS